MNSKKLHSLIRQEASRLIREAVVTMDPPSFNQDISNTQTELSPGSILLQTPGAPFGGNIAAYANVMLNNEAHMAMQDWCKFAKFAWKKYGNPKNWPTKATDVAVQLGQKFEAKVGAHNPMGVGYQP